MTTTETPQITDLDTMLRSREFDSFRADRLGNDLWLSDPERAERIHSHAEHGADGSTHAEHLQDQRDANEIFKRDGVYKSQFMQLGFPPDTAERLGETLAECIDEEIADCEKWHEKNGSLFDIIG